MSGTLDYSPAKVLLNLLIQLGKVTAAADSGSWPGYISRLPDTPDNAVAVTNTLGQKDGRAMTDGTVYEHYGYQVLVRAHGEEDAWSKANAIAIAFDGVNRTYVPIGSTTFLVQAVSRTAGILYVGYDGTSKRRLYSLNGFVCMRQMAGTGSY